MLGSLLLVAVWEICWPRRQRGFPVLWRRCGNVGIWLLNIILAAFIFAPPDNFRPQLEAAFDVALPSWPFANQGLSVVVGFLLLDFLQYTVHRCEHAVPLLWRFHALHHSDPEVDVTTSVRHHPIEYLSATGFYWSAIAVLDIPVPVVMIHAIAVFAAAAVTHGNTKWPKRLDRVLQPVVITLDLHLIHHSVSHDEANANFGAVLSVWDRLFGTYARLPQAQQDRIVFGVRELPLGNCLKPLAMLLSPWLLSRTATAPPGLVDRSWSRQSPSSAKDGG